MHIYTTAHSCVTYLRCSSLMSAASAGLATAAPRLATPANKTALQTAECRCNHPTTFTICSKSAYATLSKEPKLLPARGCLCPAVDHNSMTPGRYHPRRRCCKQHLAVPEGASRSNVPRIQGVLALGSSPELFPSKRIMDNRTPTRGLWFCLDPADPTPNCVSVPVRLCSGSAWAMYDA